MRITVTTEVQGYKDIIDDTGSIIDIDTSESKTIQTVNIISQNRSVVLNNDDVVELTGWLLEHRKMFED